MTHDELMNLLNLKPKEVRSVQSSSSHHEEETGNSPTVLQLDEWDLNRGNHLSSLPTCKQRGLSNEEMADFHGVSFLQQPEISEEGCSDQRRQEFVSTLMETPEYQSLHESTQLNVLASEMAAVTFGEQFAVLKEKDRERKEKKLSPSRNKSKKDSDLMGAIGKAIDQAGEKVEELENMLHALGMGPGQGNNVPLDPKSISDLFHRAKNNHMIRKIMQLAGRYRRLAQSKQKTKQSHGYDDMVGVISDGDVDRLLPHELVKLAEEEFELDAMRRLVERQSMCREYRGVERLGKGPIIVCVDESGSMSGEKIYQAKAFALAMAWVARHQNRYCCLIGYSGGSEGTLCVLQPGKWNQSELLNWLGHFYAGGTTMDVPLRELPTTYWDKINAPKGKTDLILITDGIVSVPHQMRRDFNTWKLREKVRTISLILAHDAGELPTVSDEVHLIREIGLTEESIGKCLSV